MGLKKIIKLEKRNKEQDIFDLDYLANIDKIKLPNTSIQLLQNGQSKAIGKMRDGQQNPRHRILQNHATRG